MIYTDPRAFVPAFQARLASADRPLILTHINPDGDAIGSLLGLWHALRQLGKQATALAMPPIPAYTEWLPGFDQIKVYQRGDELPACDLVIMVDTATIQRAGGVAEAHAEILASLPLMIVDHHVTNDGAGDPDLIQPAAASTCELLYDLFMAMRLALTPELATCLLLGITTDTQSFQTSSTSAGSLRAAAGLLEAGANQRMIIDQVYNSLVPGSAALIGRVLASMQCQDGVAWATVTRAMLRETNAPDDAVDAAIMQMRRVGSAQALVLIKENRDGSCKLSLRSRPHINVATFAQRWGGGGHAQAAGVTMPMAYAEAEALVVPLLKQLVVEGG